VSGNGGGLARAFAEGAVLVVLSAGIAIGSNAARKEPVPLRGDARLYSLDVDLPVISARDAAAGFDAGDHVFLDARDADAFRAGHVAGAFSVEPDEFLDRYAAIGSFLTGDTRTVVYGAVAEPGHVEKLAKALLDAGVTQASLLLDGYEGWAAAGGQTETGDDPTIEESGGGESEPQ